MRKSDLFDLIADIKSLSPDETLIIVGSQAAYAVTNYLPEIARRSIECDFLFAGGRANVREKVNKEFGVLTEYQDEHGYYADAVGLATIVLPEGWDKRLKPLHDDNGNLVANCIDLYDVAASKLIAGRSKDLEYLESILASELITVEEFISRLDSIKTKVKNDTLSDRLKKLVRFLKEKKIHSREIMVIEEFNRRSQ